MIKKFLKDFLKYLPSIILPGIIGFVSLPIITHIFLPVEYGNYTLIISTVTLIPMLSSWIWLSVIRFYSVYDKKDELNIFYSNIIKLTLIVTFFIASIYFLIIFLIRKKIDSELYNMFFWSTLILILSIMFETLKQFSRAENRAGIFSIFETINKYLSFALGLIIIYLFHAGIISMIYGMIITFVLILPILWFYTKPKIYFKVFIKSELPKAFITEIAKYGFPLMISNIASWILSLSDRYIINYFYASKEVGIYSASYKIAEYGISTIILLFVFASTPISIEIWEKSGKEASRIFTTKVTRFFLIISIPIVVLMSVFSKNIVDIFTNNEYHQGYKIIPLIAAGVFFLGLQQRFYAGFFFYKKTSFISYSFLIAAILNISFNLIFIPKYGYYSAAVITPITYIISLIMVILTSRRFYRWDFPFKTLLKVLLSSAVMGLSAYYLNFLPNIAPIYTLLIGICTGMAIYFIMLILIKEVKKEEWNFLRNKISKNQ